MIKITIIAVLISFVLTLNTTIKNTELRGTWFSIYEHTTSREAARTSLTVLKNLGINTIYVNVWNNGRVYFKSPTMERLLGSSAGAPARDHLGYCIEEAKKLGMKVFAWFEYGTMAAFSEAANHPFMNYARSKNWLLEGGRAAHSYIWLNPDNRDVRLFLIGIMADAIKGYPGLDGVQLDDHFAWPASLPNGEPANRRVGLMHSFAIGLVSSLKQVLVSSKRSEIEIANFVFSFSPNILPNSETTYSVKWQDWGTLFDEYIPQTYRNTYSSFVSVANDQFVRAPRINKRAIAFGIRCDGSGAMTPYNDVRDMIIWSKGQSVRGFSIWFAKGIIGAYRSQFERDRVISR